MKGFKQVTKRIACLLLSTALLAAGGISMVYADEQEQEEKINWVAPIDVQSIKDHAEGEGWSYDAKTKTLVLSGVNFDAYAGGYSYTEDPEHEAMTGWISSIFELSPGSTVIVKEGTVNNLRARIGGDTFDCREIGEGITIKGGGILNLFFNEIAIHSGTDVTLEDLTITMKNGDIFGMLYPDSKDPKKDHVFTLKGCDLTIDNCTGGIYNYGTTFRGKNPDDAFANYDEKNVRTASINIVDSNVKMNVKLDQSQERNHSCFLVRGGKLNIDNSNLDLTSYHEAVNVWKTYPAGAQAENLICLNNVKLPEDVEISSDEIHGKNAFVKGETFVKKGDKLALSFDKGAGNDTMDMSFGHKFANGVHTLVIKGTKSISQNPGPKPEDPQDKPEEKPDTVSGNAATPEGNKDNENVTLEGLTRAVTTADTDKGDVEGSKFAGLFLKAKSGKKKITLSWKKIKDADGYVIYGSPCGSKMQQITKVKGNKYTAKKLKKGKYYKYMVVAVKGDQVLSVSQGAHCATAGGKYGNPTKLTVKKKNLTLKQGKGARIKVKVKTNKKAKWHIAKYRFESSDPAVATVNKKGKVKAVSKGKCSIYVYAQNGIYKKVSVTVK
ncbi:MAG: Ig-like domain-containing protein [Lachnospiraceae bacterium]|nr:Ig-like domain-containing protein [Lachnospiraceae bacterium]